MEKSFIALGKVFSSVKGFSLGMPIEARPAVCNSRVVLSAMLMIGAPVHSQPYSLLIWSTQPN